MDICTESVLALGKRIAKMRRHESTCTKKKRKKSDAVTELSDGEHSDLESDIFEIPQEYMTALN